MRTRDNSAPQLRAGFWTWSPIGSQCQIVFLGKGPERERQRAFEEVIDISGLRLCWPRQIHSATVVEARGEGLCGEADALRTAQRGTALSVATADCLPIVVEGQRHLATIHAGWRGLAGRIIQETLAGLGEDPSTLRAWIGPAIGVCCYEVGRDVASKVVAASDLTVLRDREPRPHLDLTGAAECQLAQSGVEQIHSLSVCTHCSPDWLWSYRRDKAGAGRNWTFAWRQ